VNRTGSHVPDFLRSVTAKLYEPKPPPKLEELAEGDFFLYRGELWAVIKPASYLMTLVRQLTVNRKYANRGTDLLNKNTEVQPYSI
jgi:hypothetical protein